MRSIVQQRIGRAAAFMVALATIVAPAAGQDQPLVFVHGLGGAGPVWGFIAPAIQNQFKVQALTPSLGGGAVYQTQAANLHAALAGKSGAASVSHSNGGVVVRQYLNQYGSGSRINRHMSIGSLHTGSALAGNVLNGSVLAWGYYVFDAIRNPFQYYRLWDPDFPDLPAILMEGTAAAFAVGFGTMDLAVALFGYDLGWDVLDQMPPGSSTFNTLNSSAGLQNEASRTTARVSLATKVSPLRMPAELISVDPGLFEGIRFALMDLAAVMYYYYYYHPDLLLSANAYRWARMYWALYDINAVWQNMIGALISYRRFDMEWVSNDGVVHWFTSRYPNATRVVERVSPEINHLQQLVNLDVRNHVADVVAVNFGIALRGPPPPPPPPPQALSGTIAGMNPVPQNAECTWTASVNYGTPPYTYAWYRDGNVVGSEDSYTAMTGTSSFTLELRVWDSASGFDSDVILITVSTEPFVCLSG